LSAPPLRDWRVQGPLVASLLAIFVLAFIVCRYFLLTFTLAVAAALLLNGPHRRLTSRLSGRGGLAAGLLLLGCIVVLILPVAAYAAVLTNQTIAAADWLGPRLTPEAMDVLWSETLPKSHPVAMSWARRIVGSAGLRGGSEVFAAVAGRLDTVAQAALLGLAAIALDTMIFLMLVFFILRDEADLREALRGVSPFTRGQETEVAYHLTQTVRAVFLGLVAVPVLQGALALPCFWAAGLPSPALWSAFVVLAALVPMIGTPLVWVPAGLFLMATGSVRGGLAVLAYGALVISSVDNVLKPIILKETARVHTMLAFLFVLGGVYAFGARGIVAGPVILSLVISGYRIYRYDVLRWRERTAANESPGPGLIPRAG